VKGPPWVSQVGLDGMRSPDMHIQAPGKMSQRGGIRQREPERRCHRVASKVGFGNLQRPRRVMNLRAVEMAFTVNGIEAVAFGKPDTELAGTVPFLRTTRAIGNVALGRHGPSVRPAARVVDPAVSGRHRKRCAEVGKRVEPARCGDG